VPNARPTPSTEDPERIKSLAHRTLSFSYAAEKSYFAEYGHYTTDLKSIGFSPEETVMNFKLSFLRASPHFSSEVQSAAEEDSQRMDTDQYLQELVPDSQLNYSYSKRTEAIRLSSYEHSCVAGCTADENHFEILIILPTDDQGHVSGWSINEKKEITQILDGGNLESTVKASP
jgi:hypothetical protein